MGVLATGVMTPLGVVMAAMVDDAAAAEDACAAEEDEEEAMAEEDMSLSADMEEDEAATLLLTTAALDMLGAAVTLGLAVAEADEAMADDEAAAAEVGVASGP